MKTCPTTRRVSRSLDHDLLASVVVRLEQTLLDDDPGHGALTFGLLETDDEGFTLATHHLDVADPVEALIGFTAPPEWCAFGLVSRGRSRPMVEDGGPPRADHEATPSPVRLAVVVARSGLAVSGLRTGDGPFVLRDDGADAVGRLPDMCRRVLGLGTPPPEAPVEELFALLWVDRVLSEAASRPGLLTWSEAVDLHFGVGLQSAVVDDGCGADSPDERLAIGHALGHDLTSWAFVRDHVARLDEANDLFDPAAAAWMDDGMYSRELLAAFPPADLMLGAVEQTARPEVAAGVGRALASWRLM